MINYIINFVICSGMLLLIYRVFLGTENLYRFNRFYLLFSLVFSLAVPATTIHVPYVSMPAWDKLIANIPVTAIANKPQPTATEQMPIIVDEPVQSLTAAPATMAVGGQRYDYTITPPIPQAAISAPAHLEAAPTPRPAHNYLPEILLALYGVVTLILLFRFMRNSYHIAQVVAGSTIIDYQDTKLVLVADDVTPHSFLKYVFLNKAAYYNKTIEPEIICHEQTHVRQLHSLDVICVELLQIICWFNFFIPLYRKAIQLNHEFLADEAVIESYQDTPAYQHLLLAKASQSGSLYLTSQFNYLVTKKRIIMMTKRTTAAIALYKQLALLPVLAVAIFLFSQKSLAQAAKKAQPVSKPQTAAKKAEHKAKSTAVEAAAQDAPQSVLDEYAKILAKYGIPYKKGEKINYTPEFSAADKERVTVLYKQMSHKQQQHQYIRLAHVPTPPRLKFSEKDFKQWQTNAGYIVYIDDKQIKNSDLARYKISDFPNVLLSQMPVPSAKNGWHWKVNLMTPAYYNEYLRRGDKLYLIYMPKEKWKSTNWPIGGIVFVNKQAKVIPAAQHDAPDAIIDEYAAILAKYGLKQYMKKADFKDIDIWNPLFFAEADRARLLTLYKQMSRKQQDQQVIAFNASPSPLPKNQPTEQQLAAWKDAKEYGVWINNKKINNNELNKYKAADFDLYLIARLTPIARQHTQCHYQINLSTKANYAAYYKQAKAKEGHANIWVHIVPNPADASDPSKVTIDTRIPIGEDGRHLPLLVVNGKPFEKPIPIDFNFNKATNAEFAQLLGVPEYDILKITVLKREEATKQWGERGAYGVLMIRTGAGTKINKSVDKDHQPLIVVDGKVIDKKLPAGVTFSTANKAQTADLLSVAPNDIATISILKDTAAVIRWGSKGANGVILITTKHRGG